MARGRRDETVSLIRSNPLTGEARLIVERPNGDQTFVLGSESLIIGKDKSADVRISDPHVSRSHARVTKTETGVRIEDMGSRNGTMVNGVPVKMVVVGDSAVLSVGLSHVRLQIGDRGKSANFGGAIGSSEAMQRVFAILEKLAPSEVSLLITGETGSGKDVLARAIHAKSGRADKPFAVFDCGAVAPNLIESDLFGHEKGAFTGASMAREGVFERGDGGTVFLDEIGELPLELQPRLLRVLEQRSVSRVGGESSRKVDMRVLAATNRDLEAEVEAGRFRQDLFFRLGAAIVHVPPLRERLDDIPPLVAHYFASQGIDLTVSQAVMDTLASYDWPGNVRELRNVVESAAAMADGPTLEPRHLIFFRKQPTGGRAPTIERLPLGGRTLETLEKAAIKQTLEQCGGNKAQAARTLGIASSTLYEKIKKYDL